MAKLDDLRAKARDLRDKGDEIERDAEEATESLKDLWADNAAFRAAAVIVGGVVLFLLLVALAT